MRERQEVSPKVGAKEKSKNQPVTYNTQPAMNVTARVESNNRPSSKMSFSVADTSVYQE